ncbi:DUF1289 domain-containing protein [Iodidimonas gelatinilytica]|uniref:DUF1289 domain-containing protein n=1 Tax=Iodidimonas gelatinilytica TaxID=1236966 RepID=UPI001230C7ED
MHCKSPCTKICVLDPVLGLCMDCWRTALEIRMWGRADGPQKHAVLVALPKRRPGKILRGQ